MSPTAAKTRTCTDLGNGLNPTYPCTQYEYDHQTPEIESFGPTKSDCRDKINGASYASCSAVGFTWGMTESEMRQHDANATCATGTQLYWAEHTCYIVKDNGTSITYNDGSTYRY